MAEYPQLNRESNSTYIASLERPTHEGSEKLAVLLLGEEKLERCGIVIKHQYAALLVVINRVLVQPGADKRPRKACDKAKVPDEGGRNVRQLRDSNHSSRAAVDTWVPCTSGKELVDRSRRHGAGNGHWGRADGLGVR